MTQLTANRSNGPICFIVSIMIWTIVGWLNSLPFRSLRKLSFIAWLNVIINLTVVFLTMGFVAHRGVNYAGASATYGFTPPYAPVEVKAVISGDLANSVNGASKCISQTRPKLQNALADFRSVNMVGLL